MLPLQNIALRKPAILSSTCKWSTHDSRVEEASIGNNGLKASNDYFHTGKQFDPWWQVDLKEIYSVKCVNIVNRREYSDRLKSFSILWSHDGKSWFNYGRNKDPNAFQERSFASTSPSAARFVRIQVNGYNYLHLSEVEIFGEPLGPSEVQEILDSIESPKDKVTFEDCYGDRRGELVEIGSVFVLNDAQYPDRVRRSLARGSYEGDERRLAGEFLQPGERLLEIGTAIGAVAMTAARILGEENILTFDANPEIVSHARQNFKYNRLPKIVSMNGVLKNRRDYAAGEEVDFHIAEAFWSSRLYIGHNDKDIVRSVKVPTYCLEDEIKKFRATCIMCDIEGGEVALMNGADLAGINLIIMETHYWAIGEKKTDHMISYLISLGFSIHLGYSRDQVVVLRRHV